MCEEHDKSSKKHDQAQTTGRMTRRQILLLGASASVLPISLAWSDRTDSTGARTMQTQANLDGHGSPISPTSPQTLAQSSALEMPSPPAVTAATLYCRESWGAAPIRPGGRGHTLTQLTLHHSAVVLDDNREMAARLRQHQRFHQEEREWIDIAYHIAVDRNGQLYELRPAELVGDTATPYDPTGHFLVVLEGNFELEKVTDEQLNGVAIAFAWAAQRHNIPTNTLQGHKDVTPTTACPGANLEAFITSGELVRRVDAVVDRGPVELIPTC